MGDQVNLTSWHKHAPTGRAHMNRYPVNAPFPKLLPRAPGTGQRARRTTPTQ